MRTKHSRLARSLEFVQELTVLVDALVELVLSTRRLISALHFLLLSVLALVAYVAVAFIA